MGNFKELKVWQKSMDLAEHIYQITRQGNLINDYALKDQLRRSAISIPSNIEEGDELQTIKQGIKHFYYSRGSLGELETQLILGQRVGYNEKKTYNKLITDCHEIGSMLNGLIGYRSRNL